MLAASCRTAMLSRLSAGWQHTHLAAGVGEAHAVWAQQSAGMVRQQQQRRTVSASAAAAAGGRRDARGDRYSGLASKQAGTAAGAGGPGQPQYTDSSSGGSSSSSSAVFESRLWLMRLPPVQQLKAVGVSFDDRQQLIPQLHKGDGCWTPRHATTRPRPNPPCTAVPAQLRCPACRLHRTDSPPPPPPPRALRALRRPSPACRPSGGSGAGAIQSIRPQCCRHPHPGWPQPGLHCSRPHPALPAGKVGPGAGGWAGGLAGGLGRRLAGRAGEEAGAEKSSQHRTHSCSYD